MRFCCHASRVGELPISTRPDLKDVRAVVPEESPWWIRLHCVMDHDVRRDPIELSVIELDRNPPDEFPKRNVN
jgi:hypothetical protein